MCKYAMINRLVPVLPGTPERKTVNIFGAPDRDNKKHLYLPNTWGRKQDDRNRRHCWWSVRRRT
jgi:hypothetical protein